MKISVKERYEHRKNSIFSVCVNCRSHIKPVPGETEWPLCPDCRAFLHKRNVTSEAFLKEEIEMLLNRQDRNLLFTALLLHDVHLLKDLFAEEGREQEIDSLEEETDKILAMIGFHTTARLNHQLARLMWHEGNTDEAETLLRNSVSWIVTNCLLYSADWDDWEQELSSCYWDLAVIHRTDSDEDLYQWALKHAIVHGRMDYERSTAELEKYKKADATIHKNRPFDNSDETSEPFCGNYAATMATVYVDQGDNCAEERTEQAVRYYRKAKNLYEKVLPPNQKTHARLVCVNKKLAWVLAETEPGVR